jgi:hypothetical protein
MKTVTIKQTFWVSNMTPRNVTLADLALNIKAFSTVNLLDKRHYSYTLEQLLKSKESGSLFAKSAQISVRNVPPPIKKKEELPIVRSAFMPTRARSVLEVENKDFADLILSDEDQKKQDEIYAQENADLAELDEQRSVVNSKRV